MQLTPVATQQIPNSIPNSAPSPTGGASPSQIAQLNRMMTGVSSSAPAPSAGSGGVYRVNVGSGTPATRTLNTPTGGSGVSNPGSGYYQPKPGGSGVLPRASPTYDKYSPSSWNPSTPKPWERPVSAPAKSSSPAPQPKTVSPAPWNSSGSAPYKNLPVNQPANYGTQSAKPLPVPNSAPTAAPSPTGAPSPSYNSSPSGAGSSRFATGAAATAIGAGIAIANGENPVKAVAVAAAGYGGAQLGAAAGTAILPGIGTAVGAILGGTAAAAAAGAAFDTLFPGLNPTNRPTTPTGSSPFPINVPSDLKSAQRYTVRYDYQLKNAQPTTGGSFAYGTGTPSELPGIMARLQAQYSDTSTGKVTGVFIVPAAPILSEAQAGPSVPNPFPSQNPVLNLQPNQIPTNTKGDPVTPPKLQSSSTPTTTPSTPSTPPLIPLIPPIPARPPVTAPSLAPAPSASAPPIPSGVPTATPSGVPTNSKTPSTAPTNTTSINTTGTYQPLKASSPVTPVSATQRDRGSECCDLPAGIGDDSLLKKIAKTVGADDFPATLPLLTGDKAETVTNLPELGIWTVKNLDAIVGLFPTEIEIVGADSQKRKVKLESVSHALEEIFAALVTVAEDADATVNIAARSAIESVQAKIAAKQSGEVSTAIAKFLGFTGRPQPRQVKIGFTPAAAGINNKLENQEMEEFLKPSTQQYIGYECVDDDELLPIIKRILEDAEIARTALYHPIKRNPKNKDEYGITGEYLKKADAEPSKVDKKSWEQFLKDFKQVTDAEVDEKKKPDGKS